MCLGTTALSPHAVHIHVPVVIKRLSKGRYPGYVETYYDHLVALQPPDQDIVMDQFHMHDVTLWLVMRLTAHT